MLTQLGRRGYPFCPTNFTIDDEGQLIVNTIVSDADGNAVASDGILDLNRKDMDFITWAMDIMWPNVKVYAFVDSLKYIAVTVFGIEPSLVYGTDEDKNKPTHITWKSMCSFLNPRQVNTIKKGGKFDSYMTSREFLQYFGTNVCRKLDDDCWTRRCLDDILTDGSEVAIIQDCRFANEVKAAKKIGAKVIKLERSTGFDIHDSENGLKGLKSEYDLVIDNEHMTLREKNQEILDALYQWGWLSGHIALEGAQSS